MSVYLLLPGGVLLLLQVSLGPYCILSVHLQSFVFLLSRRPDVHGSEEALLSAHLVAGLDEPPLEVIL